MNNLKRRHFFLILILGALSTVSPFSIDFYLPAFPQIAVDFHTSVAKVALSLSSYFIALAVGQVFYGPFLDRFGRKPPLYFGLLVYLFASVGCLNSNSIEMLIALRFLQGLGGCAAQVAAVAMVRDFFPVREGAKIFSLLTLILGVSPLLAPTVGGFFAAAWGWHSIFILLMVIVALILGAVFFYLPEGHEADATVSLRALPILRSFYAIFKEPQFYVYTLAGAFSFAGLFAYVAGAPLIFMNLFHLSAQVFGMIFAGLSIGFIGMSQLNILLMRRFRSEKIFEVGLFVQTFFAVAFLIGALNGGFNLPITLFLLFGLLSCLGMTSPNGSALALAPFSKNAGSASALLGFLQIGIASLASAGVGFFETQSILPTAGIIAGTATTGLLLLVAGKPKIKNLVTGEPGTEVFLSH